MRVSSPEKAEVKEKKAGNHLPRFLLAGLVSVLGGIALDSSTVSAQSDVWPLSVSGYCNNTLGIGGEPFVEGNAWYCANGRLVELELVCKVQHAFDFHAYNSDPSNPYSWGCTKDAQTAQLPPSVTVPEVEPNDTNNYPPPPSSQPEANVPPVSSGSGLDIASFCSSLGKGTPYTVGRDWYCQGYSLIISPSEVCHHQYGSSSRAVSPNVLDPNSWHCEGGSAGVAPTTSNNPSSANNVPNPNNAPSTNNNPSGLGGGAGGTTKNKPATNSSSPSNSGGTISKEQADSIQIFTGSSTPPESGDYLRVNATSLNIRGLPGTDQPILGQVREGDYYPLVETRGDWGLITGSYGAGWVYLSYTQVYRQEATTPEQYENNRCSIPLRAYRDKNRGGEILEIPLNPLPADFSIYFEGRLVENSDWGVRHDGFAGPSSDGKTYLGIGRRWIALFNNWNWNDDSLWFISYECIR